MDITRTINHAMLASGETKSVVRATTSIHLFLIENNPEQKPIVRADEVVILGDDGHPTFKFPATQGTLGVKRHVDGKETEFKILAGDSMLVDANKLDVSAPDGDVHFRVSLVVTTFLGM